MPTWSRARIAATLTAVATASLVLSAAAQEIPAELPDPDGKAPDMTKPVKVYLLAGQSNMIGMGEISGRSSRHQGFYASAEADAVEGVIVSVYEGAYNAEGDCDQLTPEASKLARYGGEPDPFPTIGGEATYVVRGFIQVKASGV